MVKRFWISYEVIALSRMNPVGFGDLWIETDDFIQGIRTMKENAISRVSERFGQVDVKILTVLDLGPV